MNFITFLHGTHSQENTGNHVVTVKKLFGFFRATSETLPVKGPWRRGIHSAIAELGMDNGGFITEKRELA